MSAVQRRMYDALTAPLLGNMKDELRRREEAINTIIAYCAEEEPKANQVLKTMQPVAPPELDLDIPVDDRP